MDPQRLDAVTRLFASRRITRRETGSAGATPETSTATPSSAPEVTPVPWEPMGEVASYLYIQSFQQGSVSPVTGSDDTFQVTLEQGLGQTVYFSDRPERIVGATPTQQFLEGMNFAPDNPPNAALVMEVEPGQIEITVVELTNPSYDTERHTATYEAKVLKDYESTLEMGFHEAPSDLADLAPAFGVAHLFIDDCPDSTVVCTSLDSHYPCPNGNICGIFGPMGFCYSMSTPGCFPCDPYNHQNPTVEMVDLWWGKKCNDTFPICAQGDRPGCGASF